MTAPSDADQGTQADTGCTRRAWRPLDSAPFLLGVTHTLLIGWGAHTMAAAGRSASGLPRLLYAVSFCVLLVMACCADARRRGAAIPQSLRCVMLTLWPVAVPVYVIQSRRWIGLVWIALWSTTLMLSYMAGAVAMRVVDALRD